LLFSHEGKLYLVDRTTKKTVEVLSLPQPSLGSVALSRDQKTIYFTFRAAESDVWMITAK
jgi:hypothetical protein